MLGLVAGDLCTVVVTVDLMGKVVVGNFAVEEVVEGGQGCVVDVLDTTHFVPAEATAGNPKADIASEMASTPRCLMLILP